MEDISEIKELVIKIPSLPTLDPILEDAGFGFVKDGKRLTVTVLLPKPLKIQINNAPKSLQVYLAAVENNELPLLHHLSQSPKSMQDSGQVRGTTNL